MVRQHLDNNGSPLFDDSILKAMYTEHNTPCDRLVSDPLMLVAFTEAYEDRTGQTVEPAKLAHRLLTLRKLGEAKGGLPKLQRKYNGRN